MSGVPLIAIVDDDVMVCEATEDLVETFGFEPRTFSSAGELRSRDFVPDRRRANARHQRFAAPPQTRLVRSPHPGNLYYRLPGRPGWQRALSAGAVCYLSKPFDGENLRSCIRAALGLDKSTANI
jgi:FixJ family two-component response regulator